MTKYEKFKCRVYFLTCKQSAALELTKTDNGVMWDKEQGVVGIFF